MGRTVKSSGSISVIGGSDGPTSIFLNIFIWKGNPDGFYHPLMTLPIRIPLVENMLQL